MTEPVFQDMPETGAEILDATQNALIEAVTNVSELIAESSAPQETEVFYQTAEFWVGMAFVLVVILLARPLYFAGKKFLLKHKKGVIDRIFEAQNLLYDAQKLLAKYARQLQTAPEEIEQISLSSAQELEAYKTEETANLEAEFSKRQKEAEGLINTATQKARSEIYALMSAQTTKVVEAYFAKNLTAKKKSEAINTSIKHILSALKNK